eukprot:scaffold12002_cov115-Isochrysis_galbana.AAC.6
MYMYQLAQPRSHGHSPSGATGTTTRYPASNQRVTTACQWPIARRRVRRPVRSPLHPPSTFQRPRGRLYLHSCPPFELHSSVLPWHARHEAPAFRHQRRRYAHGAAAHKHKPPASIARAAPSSPSRTPAPLTCALLNGSPSGNRSRRPAAPAAAWAGRG